MRHRLQSLGRSSALNVARWRLVGKESSGLAAVPSGQGCSRWFSCSHCRANSASDDDFFSQAKYERPGLDDDGWSSRESPVLYSPSLISRPRPRLPLPPTLPYSPDSVPFQRHLEALEDSLRSDIDTSWATYQALHRSLTPYIPNYMFAGLIHHQLDDPSVRWDRVASLIRFGSQCGFPPEELGTDIVLKALRVGIAAGTRRTGPKASIDETLTVDLWNSALALHHHNAHHLPLDIRIGMLHLFWQQALAEQLQDRQRRFVVMAHAILNDLVQAGAVQGIGSLAGQILSFAVDKQSIDVMLFRLSFLATCLSAGVEISDSHIRRVIGKTRKAFEANGEADPNHRLRTTIEDIVQDLDGPQHHIAAAKLMEITEWVIQVQTPRIRSLEPGRRLLQETLPSITTMKREAIDILRRVPPASKTIKSTPPRQDYSRLGGLKVAMNLFERLAHRPIADVHSLVALITHRLISYLHDGQEVTPMINRFAKIMFQTNMFNHIDDRLVEMIFSMLALSSRTSDESYQLARRVYALARSTPKPMVWTSSRLSHWLWHSLLRKALHRRPQHHMHFASRLYADRIADGLPVEKKDALDIIRSIGEVGDASKYILLERHIKDYQYFGYGDTQDLVMRLVEGLTSRRRPKEAWFAFHLMLRILGDEPVPRKALGGVISTLYGSKKVVDYRRCLEVLAYMPSDDSFTTEMYDAVLKRLATHGVDPTRPHARGAAVAVAVEAYKAMITNQIQPTGNTVNYMVHVMLKGGFVEHAKRVVSSLLERKEAVWADTLSMTVVGLADKGKYADAMSLSSRSAGEVFEDTAFAQAQLTLAKAYTDLRRGSSTIHVGQTYGFQTAQEARQLMKERDAREKEDKEALKRKRVTQLHATPTTKLIQRMTAARAKGSQRARDRKDQKTTRI